MDEDIEIDEIEEVEYEEGDADVELGAQVEMSRTDLGYEGAVELAKKRLAADPDYYRRYQAPLGGVNLALLFGASLLLFAAGAKIMEHVGKKEEEEHDRSQPL